MLSRRRVRLGLTRGLSPMRGGFTRARRGVQFFVFYFLCSNFSVIPSFVSSRAQPRDSGSFWMQIAAPRLRRERSAFHVILSAAKDLARERVSWHAPAHTPSMAWSVSHRERFGVPRL